MQENLEAFVSLLYYTELADTASGFYKRSIREDCEGKCSKRGIVPLKNRNDTSISWQPLRGTDAKIS